jgi:hypothetical protein
MLWILYSKNNNFFWKFYFLGFEVLCYEYNELKKKLAWWKFEHIQIWNVEVVGCDNIFCPL